MKIKLKNTLINAANIDRVKRFEPRWMIKHFQYTAFGFSLQSERSRIFYEKSRCKGRGKQMVVDCKLTLEQIKALSKQMVILVDKREKKNSHITNYFTKNRIQFEMCTLDYGDYSFYIPSGAAGIVSGIYFHKEIVIERKNSLEELSGNLGKERSRFEKEMLKACKDKCRFFLMVENPRGYNAIMEHDYKTEFKPLQYITSLKCFENKYNLNIQFIDKQYAGYMIYSTFYYYMRENLN